MKCELKGDKLIITLDVNKKPEPSKSTGKTLTVASTGGFKDSSLEFQGKTLMVSANAYIKADK